MSPDNPYVSPKARTMGTKLLDTIHQDIREYANARTASSKYLALMSDGCTKHHEHISNIIARSFPSRLPCNHGA